jgi:hypothetical protein
VGSYSWNIIYRNLAISLISRPSAVMVGGATLHQALESSGSADALSESVVLEVCVSVCVCVCTKTDCAEKRLSVCAAHRVRPGRQDAASLALELRSGGHGYPVVSSM